MSFNFFFEMLKIYVDFKNALKNCKKFFVFKINAFESVAVSSPFYGDDN